MVSKLSQIGHHPVFHTMRHQPAKKTLVCGKTVLIGNIFPVTPEVYEKFHLNLDYFKPGAQILEAEKSSLGPLHPQNNQDFLGFYIQRPGGKEAPRRFIVLPESRFVASGAVIVHELLHDIFACGLPPAGRNNLVREMLQWYKITVDPRHQHLEADRQFYENISRLCSKRYKLEEITWQYSDRSQEGTPAFFNFVSEVFAHVGGLLSGLPGGYFSHKEIPSVILSHLNGLRLFTSR